MKRTLSLLAFVLLNAALLPAQAQTTAKKPAVAVKPGKNLAVVNGVPISAAMGQLLVEEQLAQNQADSPELRTAIREELIKREVLAQEAKKRNLDKNENTNARVDLARQSILLGLYIDAFVKEHPVPESDIRAEYDRQVKLAGDKEYKLRHIQTEKEEEAAAIIKKLDAGGKFEELAKDSKDMGSKDNGGDLGWMRPSDAFLNGVKDLDKGKYTKKPVKTEYGYHVILIEDTRKPEIPEFDQIKDRFRQGLTQQKIQKHVADLLTRTKIE